MATDQWYIKLILYKDIIVLDCYSNSVSFGISVTNEPRVNSRLVSGISGLLHLAQAGGGQDVVCSYVFFHDAWMLGGP